jgi:hypothetical protein
MRPCWWCSSPGPALSSSRPARAGDSDPSPPRSFPLPNGERIVSLRESTFRAAVKAAGGALRAERPFAAAAPGHSGSAGR